MKKIIIPITLSVVILIAGVFAFVPVEKASTVHGNIPTIASAQSNLDDQERVISFNIDAVADVTNFVLIPDNDVDLTGSIAAVLNDDTNGGGSASTIQCIDGTDAALEISAALTTMNTDGTVVAPTTLPDDCEAIRTTVDDGDHLIISIYINSWPEV